MTLYRVLCLVPFPKYSSMVLCRAVVRSHSLLRNIPWHEYARIYFSPFLLRIKILSRFCPLSSELLGTVSLLSWFPCAKCSLGWIPRSGIAGQRVGVSLTLFGKAGPLSQVVVPTHTSPATCEPYCSACHQHLALSIISFKNY